MPEEELRAGRYPRAYALRAGEGTALWTLGCHATLLATAQRTGGSLAVIHEIAGPHTRPPLHFHRDADEAWFVLSGQLVYAVGDERVEADAGTFVFVPRNVPHTFAVHGDRAEMLIMYSPAGFEGYFEGCGEPAGSRILPPAGSIDIERADRLAPQFHCEIVGPPIAL